MATRMQQRRGTAAQWTAANPTLEAGEIGFETDTNKFKIGDGTNLWANLDYFVDANSTVNPSFGSSITFEGATADSYETTLQVTDPTADRTITLPNASGTVITTGNLSDITDIGVFSSTITMEGSTADAFELTLSAGDPTADRTITFPDSSGTVALTSDITATASNTATLTNKTINLTNNTVSGTLAEFNTAVSDANLASIAGTETLTNKTLTSPKINEDVAVTATATEINVLDGITSSTAELNILDGVTSSAGELNILDGATLTVTELNYVDGVTSAIQTQIDGKLSTGGGTLIGALTLSGAPSSDLHAATKAYVDSVTEGLHIHASVRAATTANVTLATALENGDVLDGITLATNDRILVKNQTTQSENGIYIVQASGQPTRATDFDTAAEVDSGDFVFVSSGTVNASTGWVQINKPVTIGTDAIAFSQFSGSGTYAAGTGLTLTGNSFSVNHPVASQSGNSGKYLTTDGTNTSWGTVSGYSAPTLGSTSVASGATVSNVDGLTINSTTIPSSVTLVSTAAAQTLTTKTINLTNNTLTGTISQFNEALSDADFATLAGTQTLTNKTLTDPKIIVSRNTQTSGYTAVLTDSGKVVTINNGSANNFTIPTNASVAFPVGTQILVAQLGDGQTTITGAGVTFRFTPGQKLRTKYSSATCIKIDTDEWLLVGDLSA
jgi:hypothetical protein